MTNPTTAADAQTDTNELLRRIADSLDKISNGGSISNAIQRLASLTDKAQRANHITDALSLSMQKAAVDPSFLPSLDQFLKSFHPENDPTNEDKMKLIRIGVQLRSCFASLNPEKSFTIDPLYLLQVLLGHKEFDSTMVKMTGDRSESEYYSNVADSIVEIINSLNKGDVRDLGFSIRPSDNAASVLESLTERMDQERKKDAGFCDQWTITVLDAVHDGIRPVHIAVKK